MLAILVRETDKGLGMKDGLVVLVSWVLSAALLFVIVYWAVRLAIRHERRREPTLHERVTAERAAQRREWAEREARRRDAELDES
ncbi:hypothetical protein [Streptosporangium pseudovulgare]|uniref:CcmD family protein n=1 Tax=Streptosporangium pseudovulgare TaxID=35765 RepID=A0ABQ2RC75_9ACTN|nr:hypothetical protein [Streptosporangium pseudovulgare]GGQ24481.1 hypothetical protein GCM10010140_63390 [Streptosporangium pseudovulgare]